MAEALKKWEGQIINGKYPLRRFLGESDHSAVFLTEYGAGEAQAAAIKLVPAESATAESQLARWNHAAQLSHPNLLRLFDSGKCTVAGHDLLYLVMEFADENLSEILPQRALTAEETRDMLCPVLDSLEYLHGKGFVHADLKPANILASGDRLKLSNDTITRIGEPLASSRKGSAYDPPEGIHGPSTPAVDIWSLGMTLVEVLTQHLPESQPEQNREPLVPATLPAPFLEIARQCLRVEPHRRIAIVDVAARLNARAAAASASVSSTIAQPAPMQVAQIAPKPTVSMQGPPKAAPRMQTNPHRPPPYKGPGTRSRFILPLTIGAVFFAAILTVPRLLTRRPLAQPATAAPKGRPATLPPSEGTQVSSAAATSKANPVRESAPKQSSQAISPATQVPNQQATQPAISDTLKTAGEKEQPTVTVPTKPAPPSEEPAEPTSHAIVSAKGQVLDQVLPDVSQKARDTIRGRVRVGVKVHVDPAGAVTDAELDSAGPSKYFADLALQSARKWAFTPPERDGKSVASDWTLRFVFMQTDTKVTPTQTAP
ncbi:MAG TPA: TonB family protein [Candidatus Acidoferrum sp.]|nr:TonB family protein [Candidatus Acidoferrum sp.]